MTTPTILDELPTPNIIEPIDFDALLTERRQALIALNPEYADALALASEPLSIDLEQHTYRELILRQRVNEAAKSRLLALARDGDLDHLGDFYGVERHANEPDASYRLRIRERISASSTAGGAAHYRSRAMEVNPLAIRDVAVDSPKGGAVRVSVLVAQGYDQDTWVDKVREHVSSDEVRMLTDTLEVVPAELLSVDLEADIVLLPTTLMSVFEQLETDLVESWQQSAELGWDLVPSWLEAQLHKAGVYSVKLKAPLSDIVAGPNQSIIPGHIRLNFVGRNV